MLKSANLAELEGSDIRGHRIGVVPQQFALREDLDAVSNIVYAMDASGRTFLKPKAVLAREILQHVGFEGVSTGIAVRKLTTVEQRRIAIARAICCEAVAIVIDEPTAGLNDVESAAIMELLASLSQGRDPRRCVIAITSSEFGDAYDAVDRQIEL
jgi:ABC-type lipoprotein export system ATPase subunit